MFTGSTVELFLEILGGLTTILGIFGTALVSYFNQRLNDTRDASGNATKDVRDDLEGHKRTHTAFAAEMRSQVEAIREGCATREDVRGIREELSTIRTDLKEGVTGVHDRLDQVLHSMASGQMPQPSRRRPT